MNVSYSYIIYLTHELFKRFLFAIIIMMMGNERKVLNVVRLRILEILSEQQHTKYWLYKQMEMSYQNFNKIVNNETSSIKFDNLDKISQILDVSVGDLFEQTDDTIE